MSEKIAIIIDAFNITTIEISNDELEEVTKSEVCSTMSEKIAIIIDATWPGIDVIKEFSATVGIPYIRIDLTVSLFVPILDSYLDFRNSSNVAVICDDDSSVDQLIFYWLHSRRMKLIISERLDSTVAKKLKKVRPIPNNFVLLGKTNNLQQMLKKALDEGLTFLAERWNLLFTDFNHKDFNRSLVDGQPINLLTADEQICCQFLSLALPCTCPKTFILEMKFLEIVWIEIQQIFLDLTNEKYDITGNVICEGSISNSDSTDTSKKFHKLLGDVVKNNHLIHEDGGVLRVKMRGNIEIGNKVSTEIVASYDSSKGLEVLPGKVIKPIRTFYRIGITHAIPWSFKETDEIGQTYWTGYCADFAHKLAEMMDFDFEFVEPTEGGFGEKHNGKWNGIVGDLQKGDTDLAITALVMTADKEEVIDFVPPYFEQSGISIVMRKPFRETSLFKFMTVLKLEVWLSIVGALVVTALTIWFVDTYSPYSSRNNKEEYPYPCREFTLKESFWFALTSFTPQGGGEPPKSLSGRTLVAAYWLFVVLMLATFTANLAAFLTVERMQTPVQSLEQLSRQSRINYTVIEGSETHKYFINMKHAEDTIYRMWKELTLNASPDDQRYRVWDYPIKEQWGHILTAINDSNPVPNASEGFRLVTEHIDGDFAFIHDSSEIKYAVSKNCNFTEVGDIFAEKPYAVAVQQGSHMQDDISRAILTLQTDRFFEDLQAKYWNHSAKGDCANKDENEGITLDSLGGVFIATLFGLALAMVTLVGEIIYYRNLRQKMEKETTHQIGEDDKKTFRSNIKLIKPETITIGKEFKPINYNTKNRKLMKPIPTIYPLSKNQVSHGHLQGFIN
ncbi:hypothetical protein WA026_013786 [Henosepilachna vigintioctopunctata]|uniref:Ionotropic receptor 8a n=1 Tax=Henosepilachna vigintioctopunctata TaxID=420089 RepID=A0AAW1UR10_9CUCU